MPYIVFNIAGKEGSAWWLSFEALVWMVCFSQFVEAAETGEKMGEAKVQEQEPHTCTAQCNTSNIIGIEKEERINEVKGVPRARKQGDQSEGQATGKK